MILIDDSAFPFVTVRFEGSHDDEEVLAAQERLDAIRSDATQRYVVLFDLSAAAIPSGRQLRLQADWLKRNTPEIRRKVLANAFVVATPAAQATLKAFFTLADAAIPYAVLDDADQARSILERYLARERSVA